MKEITGIATLFPARAGVIPVIEALKTVLGAIPRTRGGDPARALDFKARNGYSPHARG